MVFCVRRLNQTCSRVAIFACSVATCSSFCFCLTAICAHQPQGWEDVSMHRRVRATYIAHTLFLDFRDAHVHLLTLFRSDGGMKAKQICDCIWRYWPAVAAVCLVVAACLVALMHWPMPLPAGRLVLPNLHKMRDRHGVINALPARLGCLFMSVDAVKLTLFELFFLLLDCVKHRNKKCNPLYRHCVVFMLANWDVRVAICRPQVEWSIFMGWMTHMAKCVQSTVYSFIYL